MEELKQVTPRAEVTFSDDIRQEIGDKISLNGIYEDAVILHGSPPFTIPKLCVSIRYYQRPSDGYDPIRLVIERKGENNIEVLGSIDIDRSPFKNAEFPTDDEADDPQIKLAMNAVFAPLVVTRSGRLKVFIEDNGKRLRVGSMMFKFSSTQPAENGGSETATE